MPVSSISVSVDCSSKAGAFRWIGSVFSVLGAGLLSIGSPRTLKIRPRVFSPTGNGDGRAGCNGFHAAHQTIRRTHGDASDRIVAEML